MKVLITGGAGFIGSHITKLLVENQFDVVVVDTFVTGAKQNLNDRLKVYHLDVTTTELETVFKQEIPDYVIHLAAQVGVESAQQDPLLDAKLNILGTINVLEQIIKYDVKKMVFASSAAVYGPVSTQTKETALPNPISFYGLSKHVGEMYVKMFASIYSFQYNILRFSNIYGPNQSPDNECGVIPTFIHNMTEGKTTYIYGDGLQTRDFLYVKDAALASLACLKQNNSGVFNISSHTETTIQSLHGLLAHQTGYQHEPHYLPEQSGAIKHSRLDNSYAKQVLNWEPQYSLYNGLLETVQYFNSLMMERGK